MGFFDRLASKKSSPPSSLEQGDAVPNAIAAASGGVIPQLLAARQKLEAKELPEAMAIYEDVLRTAGDRPDVLVTISGDLGSCGFVEQIVELVAPRYDAERHGPATGLNLLQAYLATHNSGAAQHLLDILFALQRPELQERLYGFSNALAELIEAEKRGLISPASGPNGEGAPPPAKKISLATISRPIWAYGLEAVPSVLPPPKEGKLRKVAFAQLSLLGDPAIEEKTKSPEDALARLCRGIPLWLAETLYFCPHYAPVTAIATMGKEHYAMFPGEWNTTHLRQLVDGKEDLDYIFTGALQHRTGDFELIIRLWEVKKFRERKVFNFRWTPATADAELAKLHEQIRIFMEWSPYPSFPYAAPASPLSWCDGLASATSFFLADKGILPKEQLASPPAVLATCAERAAASATASLNWLTVRDRALRLGFTEIIASLDPTLHESNLVAQAREALGA